MKGFKLSNYDAEQISEEEKNRRIKMLVEFYPEIHEYVQQKRARNLIAKSYGKILTWLAGIVIAATYLSNFIIEQLKELVK